MSSSKSAKIKLVTAAQPADIEVAEFAGQLFFRLWRASHTRTADALATIGLTPALFGVLNFLGHHGAAIQLEIASAMGIDPSAMVALIDELEGAGLAKRRPHPADRRAREVTLTAKGHRTLKGLRASDRRELVRLLRRALEEAPPQSPWRAEEGD
jgi:DNA-binding MarR family transcriptional regulator